MAENPVHGSDTKVVFTAEEWVWVATVLVESDLVPPSVASCPTSWHVEGTLVRFFSTKFHIAVQNCVVETSSADKELHVSGAGNRVFPNRALTPANLDEVPSVAPVSEHPDIMGVLMRAEKFLTLCGGFTAERSTLLG